MEDKKNNYELCYENLCREFAKHKPEEMASKSRAKYDSEKKQFLLTYLNREYVIFYPDGRITLKDDDSNSSRDSNDDLSDKMIIMSYLMRCTNSELTKKWVPFRELQGVGHAYDGFSLQGVNKLVEFFGDNGELFSKAGDKLGAKKYSAGDMGLEIDILPNVPVVLVLWLKDEEFKADASILFDYSATKELHVEDLAALCSMVADEMIRVAKEISQ
jgi:hypothetical protein